MVWFETLKLIIGGTLELSLRMGGPKAVVTTVTGEWWIYIELTFQASNGRVYFGGYSQNYFSLPTTSNVFLQNLTKRNETYDNSIDDAFVGSFIWPTEHLNASQDALSQNFQSRDLCISAPQNTISSGSTFELEFETSSDGQLSIGIVIFSV